MIVTLIAMILRKRIDDVPTEEIIIFTVFFFIGAIFAIDDEPMGIICSISTEAEYITSLFVLWVIILKPQIRELILELVSKLTSNSFWGG